MIYFGNCDTKGPVLLIPDRVKCCVDKWILVLYVFCTYGLSFYSYFLL